MFVQKPEWTFWLTQCYSNISPNQVINFYFTQSVWTAGKKPPKSQCTLVTWYFLLPPSSGSVVHGGGGWDRECMPQWCVVLGEKEFLGQCHKPWHPLLQRSVQLRLVSSHWILRPFRLWKGSRVILWWFISPSSENYCKLYLPWWESGSLIFSSHFSSSFFISWIRMHLPIKVFFVIIIFCSLTHLPEPFCLFSPLYYKDSWNNWFSYWRRKTE